jgi:5-methylcytosine-specific restriction endonuclease McrA
MSIHEHLPLQAREDLTEVGWTKGLELAKVPRAEVQECHCATWLHEGLRDGPVQAGNCGSLRNLEVHYMRLRSHQGGDVEENLLTLCSSCHKNKHHLLGARPRIAF